MSYKASAPGSLMLLGEYAVLYGTHAVACAVDKRVNVILTPRTDTTIEIHSTLLGDYTTDLANLTITKPFQFVLGVLKHYQAILRKGCTLEIHSDFSDKVGLGSSAAVTVATLAALVSWLDIRMSPIELVRHGRQVVREVQGVGSGTDIAASVYGGLVGYQMQPKLVAEKFSVTPAISVLYAGYKTPTVEVIKRVQDYFSAHINLFRSLRASIGQCAFEGMQHIRRENWKGLGEIMNMQQGLMESLGVCAPVMSEMVHELRKHPSILGAKISGSGLGDCVIGLGELPRQYQYQGVHVGVKCIPVTTTLQGVHCERI